MISFDEFLKQDEADKYNMLQECNAIIQQKEKIIKEVREYIESKEYVKYGIIEVDEMKLRKILDKENK